MEIVKKTGGYRRKVRKAYENMLKLTNIGEVIGEASNSNASNSNCNLSK